MKAWTRARVATRCGGCGRLVDAGDPLIAFTFPAVHRRLWRCVSCAEAGQPPPDLPSVTPLEAWRPFVHLRTGLDALPLDFKARAGGEREPGEDE